MRRPLAGTLALAVAFSAAPCQCPPQGVTVVASGGRLGDPWRIDAQAGPGLVGVLGLDLSGGPVATPLGTICLGLTPALQLHTLLFDSAGRASFQGVMPPNPAFAGFDIHAVALSLDPSLPNGLGLSNGDSLAVRQPRFWFVDPGSSTPFGTTPGAIAATNVVTDDLVFSQTLAASVRDVATVRERGWLVLLLADGSLAAWDGAAMAPAWTLQLAGSAAQANRLLAPPGGDTLLLLGYGTAPSPFGGGTPGAVHVVSIATGAVNSMQLPAGNPDAMLHVPDTNLVMLRIGDGVVPFAYDALVLLPPIALPGGFGALVDWRIGLGPLLYVLHGGQAPNPFGGTSLPAAISIIDVSGLSLLSTTPLAMAPPVQLLRTGIGSVGPAVFAYGSAAAAIEEFEQVTLAPVATMSVGAGITAIEPSSLGSQLLLLCSGGGCGGPAVLGLDVGTTTAVTLLPLGGSPAPQLAVSPSVLFGKACTAVGNAATPFGTDPFVAAMAATLPFSSAALRIVVD